ncbi:hypothetical protein [Roseomonas sp. BN140053]|uniref:hypothetical protein n=1 Tax=Roseomonas sp. BN140053 TaxID=3391898 RepID=UPI0039EAC759
MRIAQDGQQRLRCSVKIVRRSALCGVLIALAAGLGAAITARAQDVAAERRNAGRQVVQACADYTRRYCPALAERRSPSAQSQVICLKHYKANLSLACRSAVNAASQ